MDINRTLTIRGFNKKQIEKFTINYNNALELKVPYPIYYAMLKTMY